MAQTSFNMLNLWLICMLCTPNVFAAVPWVYGEGESSMSLTYVDEHYDELWAGDVKGPQPHTTQQNLWLDYHHGISDKMMFSAQLGYTQSQIDLAGSKDFSGLADTGLALQYQWLNEFVGDSPITLSGRVGLIIRGTYDRASPGNPNAPGDKANGLDLSFQLGRYVLENTALFGELGYRALTNEVPDEIYYHLGVSQLLPASFTLTGGYGAKSSRSGLDIGGPGFTGEVDLHKVKEEQEWLELDLRKDFGANISVDGGIVDVIDGKNTKASKIWFITFQRSF